ncbi:MAG: Holliday junction resolvase Hjc [archaeon]
MARYNKGANAERSLLADFWEKGFAVVRAAGSGGMTLPSPDLIALRKDKKYLLEAKAWKGNYLHLKNDQMEELKVWAKRSGCIPLIAWKIPHKGWRFLKITQFNNGLKGYTINKEKALTKGKTLDEIT